MDPPIAHATVIMRRSSDDMLDPDLSESNDNQRPLVGADVWGIICTLNIFV